MTSMGQATKIGLLTSAFLLAGMTAASPKAGQRTGGGRTQLYREKVEIYWNDWSGMKVYGRKGDQTDVHIKGEGKTVDFDGTLSINCQSGSGYLWKNASNFQDRLSEADINRTVTLQVIANAKRLFC